MPNTIFFLHEKEGLIPLIEQNYETEAVFQELLTKYPELLLFGDERTPYSDLLLIKREQGIPIEKNGSNWFSVDHLFVDKDGILTIIEVKRRGDTRNRREVIAQMLDYVTNGLSFWSIDELRNNFSKTYFEQDLDPDEILTNFLGEERDINQFWIDIEDNLRKERIRMVFVADVISPEMKRIVEFLSRQMKSASICAIELKQYVGKGFHAFIPDVITSEPAQNNMNGLSPGNRQWNEITFFEELKRNAPKTTTIAEKILSWGKENCTYFWWGKGKKTGSFAPILSHKGIDYYPSFLWTTGYIDIQFQYLRIKPPFDQVDKINELKNRLNTIPGVDFLDSSLTGRPSFPMKLLIPQESLEIFIGTLQWIIDEIKRE